MGKVTKEQYEFAPARIEELLPLADNDTPANDRNAVEPTMMSDVVTEYEKEHFPIGKPTVAQLIQLSLEDKQRLKSCWLQKSVSVHHASATMPLGGQSQP